MKGILQMFLVCWVLASQVLAQQPKVQLAEVITAVTVDQLFDFLVKNEVDVSKVTSSTGTTYLVVKYGEEQKLYVDFYDCEQELCGSLLLSAGFTPKKPPSLEAINNFNYEYRFARAYLDGKEAWIESDLLLEVGVVLDGLLIWMDDFAATVNDFTAAIGFE